MNAREGGGEGSSPPTDKESEEEDEDIPDATLSDSIHAIILTLNPSHSH